MITNTPFAERHYSDDEARDYLSAYLKHADPPAAERAAITYLMQTFPQAGRYVDYTIEYVSDLSRIFGNSDEAPSTDSEAPTKKPGEYHIWGFEWDVMTERLKILPDNERRAARIALAILNRTNTVSIYDLPRDPQALADLISLLPGTQDSE